MLRLQTIVLCILQIAILVQCKGLSSIILPETSRSKSDNHDAGQNLIKLIDDGVSSEKLQLSGVPPLDTLPKGEVLQIVETNFDIKDYVLPKFEVKIEIPKNIPIAGEEIPITINAKYGYGYGKLKNGTDFVSANANFHVVDDGQQQQLVEKTVKIDGKGIGNPSLLSREGQTST